MIKGSCSFSRESTVAASTGISVSEITSDPRSAKSTVSAIGRKSLPSVPSRNRIGR